MLDAKTWWVCRRSDGLILRQEGSDRTHDPAAEVVVGRDPNIGAPDRVRERWDGAEGFRPATSEEQQAARDADNAARFLAGSRHSDVLATCAVIAMETDPTWAAMTLPQRRAKVVALADKWVAAREFVEAGIV